MRVLGIHTILRSRGNIVMKLMLLSGMRFFSIRLFRNLINIFGG